MKYVVGNSTYRVVKCAHLLSWHLTLTPVGRWMSWTALEVVATDWPPGPLPRIRFSSTTDQSTSGTWLKSIRSRTCFGYLCFNRSGCSSWCLKTVVNAVLWMMLPNTPNPIPSSTHTLFSPRSSLHCREPFECPEDWPNLCCEIPF